MIRRGSRQGERLMTPVLGEATQETHRASDGIQNVKDIRSFGHSCNLQIGPQLIVFRVPTQPLLVEWGLSSLNSL